MADSVKRRYDNTRRQAQVRATRLNVIETARRLFIESGYPATTLETVADAADVSLPTLYRLFGSKRALLAAVLDTSFGGDDEAIAFGERPAVRAARNEADPLKMVEAFGLVVSELMERASPIQHVLSTAAQVDPEAADLLEEIRRQRYIGQSRMVAALVEHDALDPDIDPSKAADIVYACMSPDVHRILTIERGWTTEGYQSWIVWCLRSLLSNQARGGLGATVRRKAAPAARGGRTARR